MNNPVPCISGHAGRHVAARLPSRIAASTSGGRVPGLDICQSATYRSSERHITALGLPVVPPVYKNTRSSPDGARSVGATWGAPAIASS